MVYLLGPKPVVTFTLARTKLQLVACNYQFYANSGRFCSCNCHNRHPFWHPPMTAANSLICIIKSFSHYVEKKKQKKMEK